MQFATACMVLFALLSLGACSVSAPPIKEHSGITVPDGKASKTLALKKVTTKVPRNTHIGKVGEGLGCLGFAKLLWKSGRGNIADEELTAAFVEELKLHNYNVLGDPDDLFDDKSGQAELIVGALIRDIKWDICYHNGYIDGWSSGSTYVELSVEWQVYNAMDKKVIYKHSTVGQAKVTFTDKRSSEGFMQAFAHATQGLLADKGFFAVASKGDKPGKGDNFEGIAPDRGAPTAQAASGSVFATKGRKTPITEVTKQAVVIQVPGSHGSGFFINSRHILTNHHVVGDNTEVRVLLQDGTKLEGRVLNRDARRDVALVAVEGSGLNGLGVRLGDLPVGTEVFAVGAPIQMGLQGSVTKGIVSSYRMVRDQRMLQSDVAIYGGNSGGPLVDGQGQVVGICQSRMTATQGFNFFIPIDEGLSVMNVQAK